jgi:hypothetical protein
VLRCSIAARGRGVEKETLLFGAELWRDRHYFAALVEFFDNGE